MNPTKEAASTRERIVQAADDLFYRQGFERTSFADIAEVVKISRGNFYHHFKTKDDILDAVVELRVAQTREMIERWETKGATPRERIGAFIDILVDHLPLIARYGCPVGTLCSELAKLNHPARSDASRLFTLFRTWLRRQLELLGRPDADWIAMHLLARTQGAAALASAFYDEDFLRREAEEIHAWLDATLAKPARRRPRATKVRHQDKEC